MYSRQKPRAEAPNQVWSRDFVADQFRDGRRFRALTVVDVYTRECVAIEVGQSLKGHEVVRCCSGEHRRFFSATTGANLPVRCWIYGFLHVKTDLSRPGKPTDNAYVESFNGTLRAECLDAHWFAGPSEAV